jgi:PAS domain S-box-containing protein
MPPRQKIPPISPEREERLRHLMESTAIVIFCITFDPPIDLDLPESKLIDLIFENGTITEANEAWAHMVGLESAEKLLGVKIRDFAPRSTPENLDSATRIVQSRFTLKSFESVEMFDSGEKRFFHNNAVWVLVDGKVMRFWGTATDITEIRTLEKELETAESGYRFLVDTLQVAHDPEMDPDILMRLKTLTSREHETMTFVIAGLKNKEVARALGIAESTVKIHRRRVMEKLEISSIAELVRLCEAAGIKPAEAARE